MSEIVVGRTKTLLRTLKKLLKQDKTSPEFIFWSEHYYLKIYSEYSSVEERIPFYGNILVIAIKREEIKRMIEILKAHKHIKLCSLLIFEKKRNKEILLSFEVGGCYGFKYREL